MRTTPKLTLEDAKVIVAASEKKATELGVDMDIAVTDDGGHLLMFVRMDRARITSISIAIDKAWTAAGARRSTRDYAASAAPGQAGFGLNTSNDGRFMIFAGGLPVFIGEDIVGGVGCSSGHPDQDEAVAQAGIDALLANLAESAT